MGWMRSCCKDALTCSGLENTTYLFLRILVLNLFLNPFTNRFTHPVKIQCIQRAAQKSLLLEWFLLGETKQPGWVCACEKGMNTQLKALPFWPSKKLNTSELLNFRRLTGAFVVIIHSITPFQWKNNKSFAFPALFTVTDTSVGHFIF